MITEIPKGGRVPPHAALLREIESRRGSFAVQASGMAPVLDMLSAYIATTEARLSALEQSEEGKR